MTALYQIFFEGAEAVIHVLLATGFALISSSASDFGTPRWVNWIARAATGVLAAILFLQGVSELIQNDSLTNLVYQVLGQRLETWLMYAFLLWCATILLVASEGRTRLFGVAALSFAICTQAYSYLLSYLGTSLDAQSQGMKALYLLLFVWILLESIKARAPAVK